VSGVGDAGEDRAVQPRRFDALARGLSDGLSRRRVMRLLGLAGGAAIVAAAPGGRQAAAGTRCIPDGGGCADICGAPANCNACCGGYCAAYGGCVEVSYLGLGETCYLADPSACDAGLTCCPFRPGQRHGQGTCQDVCY
jgi:hypothetical protein